MDYSTFKNILYTLKYLEQWEKEIPNLPRLLKEYFATKPKTIHQNLKELIKC
jgi:hypothetical protein